MTLAIVLLASVLTAPADQGRVTPLPQAHAHNDYQHERPLADALAHGFCSFEADVFLVRDDFLVGHTVFELRKGRTLKQLYLDPLRKRVKANKGRVYQSGPTVTLLIDIKVEGERVYPALASLLAQYKDIVSSVEDGKYHERAVQVVISGDRPQQLIAADKTRFAAIDGRISDLDSDAPAHLLPLISDRWTSHFRWRGQGAFPAAERKKLRDYVQRAHTKGRRIRFWATPEEPAVWRELLNAEVDHINTDELGRLSKFLREHQAERDK